MLGNGGLIALDAATGRERWTQSIGGPVPATAPLQTYKVLVEGDGMIIHKGQPIFKISPDERPVIERLRIERPSINTTQIKRNRSEETD